MKGRNTPEKKSIPKGASICALWDARHATTMAEVFPNPPLPNGLGGGMLVRDRWEVMLHRSSKMQ